MSDENIKNEQGGQGDAGADIRAQVEKRKLAEESEHGSPEPKKPGVSSKFVLECLYQGELGNGLLYARLNRGKFVYVHNFAEWYRFTGHHWERDIKQQALAEVETVVDRYILEIEKLSDLKSQKVKENAADYVKILEGQIKALQGQIFRLRTESGRQNCLKCAIVNREPLAIAGDELDKQPLLLACKNGVVDLSTGQFRDGLPEDYISKASPIEFDDIEAKAPAFEKFMMEIMSDDRPLVDYLQRLFGYAVTGLDTEHLFIVFHGQGRNGKSKLIEILHHVLGPLVGSIQAEMLLDQFKSKSSAGPSPDKMSLMGLRIAIGSETDQHRRFSPSAIKLFTGGDKITGRNPHDKHETTFDPTHSLFLLTNNKPHAPADDFAFWERIRLIPFLLSFVDREPEAENERRMDKEVFSKLKVEAPQILAWLVKGCLMWQKQGLKPPESVTKATAEYRKEEDLILEFIEDCCEVKDEYQESATELYTTFETWFEENIGGKNTPKQRKFGDLMTKKFEKKKVGGRVRYFGLKLKSKDEEDIF